jgi:methylglutaconyl-CoA hydratase
MFMQTNVVEIKVTPPVGTIVLNRPESANAVSMAMVAELQQALSDLHQEKRVRAVIVTGSGEAFCTGRDLAEMAADHADSSIDPAELHERWGEEADELCDLVSELLAFPKPIISAVNGPVGGFGVALLMASDLVLACDAAELSISEARYGLVAGLLTPLVAYRAGAGAAARLAVMGQTLSADEAHRLGIYHEIVPHDFLWARGMQVGEEIATAAPQAIGLTKRLLMETVGEKLLTDLASGAIATATARTTDAAREGLQAYMDERAPEWE